MQRAAHVPPQSLESEQAVLGAMLLEREAIEAVREVLPDPEMHYREAHKLIHVAACDLADRREPVDLTTLAAELEASGQLAQAGGRPYLASLLDAVPTAAHAEYYARIVRAMSVLRKLIGACTEAIEEAFSEGDLTPDADQGAVEKAETLVLRTAELIAGIAQTKQAGEWQSLREGLAEAMDRLDMRQREEGPQELRGIPSGLAAVDLYTGGWRPGQLVYVGGRPGMGKTAFMLGSALAAGEKGHAAAVFSFEMGREEMQERALAMGCRVNSVRIRSASLEDDHWHRLMTESNRMGGMPVHWWCGAALTPSQLLVKARRFRSRTGRLDLMVVDYLQLMRMGGRSEGRTQEVDEISRSLKRIATELEVPVLVGSQLGRRVEDRNPPRPVLGDLRESGSIEADANVVVLLYNPEYYRRQKAKESGETEQQLGFDDERVERVEAIIAKQRNGPGGTAIVGWQPNYVRFVDLEERQAPPRGKEA